MDALIAVRCFSYVHIRQSALKTHYLNAMQSNIHVFAVSLVATLSFGLRLASAEPISLSVNAFRPLDTQLVKWNVQVMDQNLEGNNTALTAEERAILTSHDYADLREYEIAQKVWERARKVLEVEQANAKREEQIEKIRQRVWTDDENRPLVEAHSKLITKLSQYEGAFKLLERDDVKELMAEASGESADKAAAFFSAARIACSYKVLVSVGDLHTQEHSGSVGGVGFKDTYYTRDFIVKVSEMGDGSVALSRTITVKATKHNTSVANLSGDTIFFKEMIDSAVEQIAEAIYGHFFAKVDFKYKPSGKIDGFDPSNIAIEVVDASGETVATKRRGPVPRRFYYYLLLLPHISFRCTMSA